MFLGAATHRWVSTTFRSGVLGLSSDFISQSVVILSNKYSDRHFSYLSLVSAAYGGALASVLTRGAGSISTMIIGSMPDAVINSIGYYFGQKQGW